MYKLTWHLSVEENVFTSNQVWLSRVSWGGGGWGTHKASEYTYLVIFVFLYHFIYHLYQLTNTIILSFLNAVAFAIIKDNKNIKLFKNIIPNI